MPQATPSLAQYAPAEPPGITQFSWQAAAFVAAVSVAFVTILIVVTYRKYDKTGGLFTLSILLVQGFITASFASMIYSVPQNPITEILVGAMATSLGAVIAYWMSGTRPHPDQEQEAEEKIEDLHPNPDEPPPDHRPPPSSP